jgi:hypothetical protein
MIRLSMMFLACSFMMHGQAVQCRPPDPTRGTVWGHNPLTVELSDKPLKSPIRGVVRVLLDQPVDDVLVEVLQLGPTESPAESSDEARLRRRVASCVTDSRGEFGFDLAPGRYEILCSKQDFNSTSMIIVVSPKGKRRNIDVPLEVGT